MIVWNYEPQGSEAWLAARRGAITGSRARDALDVTSKRLPGAKRTAYAMDVARERVGGMVPATYQNAAMKMGTEQEPIARVQYEAETGSIIAEVGFAHTEDKKFGASVDGLIGSDGIWECKTAVSSATLFRAIVDGDISDYRDQCLFAMWLLGRRWVDLSIWCADLQLLHTVRIKRNDDEINAFEAKLLDFDALVRQYEAGLRAFLPAAELSTPPWTDTYQPASSAATLTPSNVPAPKTTAPADVLAPSF